MAGLLERSSGLLGGEPTPAGLLGRLAYDYLVPDYLKPLSDAEYRRRAAHMERARGGDKVPQMQPDAGERTAQAATDLMVGGLPTAAAALPLAIARKGGIRAYHGSPHDFDRFDMSKIGTGEGAQAYGHGLYFAENEATARAYRDQVKDMVMINRNNARMSDLAKEMDRYAIPGKWREYRDPRGYAAAEEYDALMAEKMRPGRMYEVNIRAQPEQFLDWDRPLAEQSVGLQKQLESVYGKNLSGVHAEQTMDINDWRNMLRADSKYMGDAGIPGIKYLDQGSRRPAVVELPNGKFYADHPGSNVNTVSKGTFNTRAEAEEALDRFWPKQTSNYVVFDDNLIDILRKYGLAGLAALPALNGKSEEKQ